MCEDGMKRITLISIVVMLIFVFAFPSTVEANSSCDAKLLKLEASLILQIKAKEALLASLWDKLNASLAVTHYRISSGSIYSLIWSTSAELRKLQGKLAVVQAQLKP